MANTYTGLALAAWVAKAAARSKAYKVRADGIAVFRLHISVGVYGFIGTLATAACRFIPQTDAVLMILVITWPLFIPFLLHYLIAWLYIDDEKITYRNLLGFRREIAWKDLNAAVRIGITGDMMLCGGGRKVRLYPYFSGFSYVLEMMRKYRPEAFDEAYMLSHAADFKAVDGRITFRWLKQFRTLAIIIMLYGFGFDAAGQNVCTEAWLAVRCEASHCCHFCSVRSALSSAVYQYPAVSV